MIDSDMSTGGFDGRGPGQPLEFNYTESARHGRDVESMKDWLPEAEDMDDLDEEDEDEEDLAQEALCDGVTEAADEDLLGEDDEPLYNGNTRPVGEWQSKVARSDDELLDKKNYAPRTIEDIHKVEKYWVMYVLFLTRCFPG